ncbi:DUF535 family protein [Asticcacaulis sp. EMRT-3]|uniref:DUF535 family protein n=1 Tax=Asticcacaulis sp. EMRT-3 TaxID=3040349 RepID=UPI0024AF0888|nr:DUF535 family protein [Asticcacaulis sp. EMRT-3]MDI7774388.1 DUF535 family protein [Asticcacaulis sp. EMRT-3]
MRFFVMKYWQMYPWSSRWIAYTEANHQLYTGQEPPIEMVRTKFARSYYNRKLSPRKKLDLLTGHYDYEAAILCPDMIASLMRGEIVSLARLNDKLGQAYSFSLHRHERYRAEGEITLFLKADNEDLALAALTFHLGHTADGRPVLRIGGLQGPAAEDAKQRIIATTRALHGWRPKAACLYVAGLLANIFGADTLEAVPDALHPLRNARHAFVANNDLFWLENGAQTTPEGYFKMAAHRPETRAAADIPAKKRKDWLARQALKHALNQQIAETLGLALLSAPEIIRFDHAA